MVYEPSSDIIVSMSSFDPISEPREPTAAVYNLVYNFTKCYIFNYSINNAYGPIYICVCVYLYDSAIWVIFFQFVDDSARNTF